MIQMTNGFTNYNGKLIDPKCGPVELPVDVERRLVALGVAKYAGTAVANGEAAEGGIGASEAGVNTFDAENTAESAQGALAEIDVNECVDFDESGHMTVESLMKMTRANMEALAEDLGVDVRKCKNKAEIAALIAQMEVGLDEQHGEGPTLSAAVPS